MSPRYMSHLSRLRDSFGVDEVPVVHFYTGTATNFMYLVFTLVHVLFDSC